MQNKRTTGEKVQAYLNEHHGGVVPCVTDEQYAAFARWMQDDAPVLFKIQYYIFMGRMPMQVTKHEGSVNLDSPEDQAEEVPHEV